jgi:hypothetical protein
VEDLQRHGPAEHLVGRQVDAPHASAAEAALEPVAAGDEG